MGVRVGRGGAVGAAVREAVAVAVLVITGVLVMVSVADGVKVRSLHWDEAERWGMRMELTGGSNLFGLLHSQWPMGEYDFNGYRIFMGRLPDESALLRIVGERGRMDLREAYEYLRTVQEPKMDSAEKTGVRA